jgi:APA family basic amino acid/polyamine antiporter
MTAAEPNGGTGDLLKILRVRDGLAVTVGIVIGVGILRTPGLIAGYLGSPLAMLGVWIFGGVVVVLSTLVLAEMAAALPQAGGKYVYAREAYGPKVGFVVGWSELLATRGFSGGAKAVVIAEYIVLLLGRGSVPILAGTVVLAFFLLHSRGLRAGRDFQNLSTLAKVLFILAIGAAGVMGGDGSGFLTTMEVSPEFAGLLGIALAYQATAFAYYGWEEPAKLAEETGDPGRSLPRILVGGATAVAILYLLINLAFLSALTPEEMAGSQLVAADALHATFGGAAGTFVTIASLVILLSSLNVQFLGMPRVLLGLAREGMAPSRFTRVSLRGTPQPALVLISVILLVLAITGAFEFLMRFMMAIAFAVDLVVLAGIFVLRRRRPDLHRPVRVPFFPWLPGVTVLLYSLVLATIVWTQPWLGAGAGFMLGGLWVAGWATLRASRRDAPSR